LLLEHDLSAVPSFEFALRERTARLADFRPASYARVHRIERRASQPMRLAVVSDHLEGTRLSDLLRVADDRRLDIDISAWLCVIQQLLPAVALLHEHAPDVANGLIAPERIILTPHARLFVVEHVLGGAIEQLQYRRERLWRELRIAAPPGRGPARLDHRADMTSVGLVALALVLGRPLQSDEFPDRVSTLLHEARERTALGYERPLSQPLRDWITRALQLEPGAGFASAAEARDTFEGLVAADSLYIPAQIALEVFLARCTTARHDRPAIDPFPSAPLSPAVSQPAPAITRQSQSERTAAVSPVYDDTSVAPQPGEPDWESAARQPSIVATSLDIRAILSASDQPSPDGAVTFLDQPPELIEVVATDSPYVLPQSPAVAARRRALAAGRSALAACWRGVACWRSGGIRLP
jgi:hypothetical protein